MLITVALDLNRELKAQTEGCQADLLVDECLEDLRGIGNHQPPIFVEAALFFCTGHVDDLSFPLFDFCLPNFVLLRIQLSNAD